VGGCVAPSPVSMTNAADPLWNPWANDHRVLDLYRRRCRLEADEMTCAAQAAEILAERVRPGETLLDAGCGGGYYYWSFRKRAVPVKYHGLDYTPEMIELARAELRPAAGLPLDRFTLGSIENLDLEYDNILWVKCQHILLTPGMHDVGGHRVVSSATVGHAVPVGAGEQSE